MQTEHNNIAVSWGSSLNPEQPRAHVNGLRGWIGRILDHRLRARYSIVRGARIASRSLTKALVEYGAIESCEIFTLPQYLMTVIPYLGLRPPTLANVKVRSYVELMRTYDRSAFTLWYDQTLDLATSTYLRQIRSRNLYPVICVHHAISYQSLLHKCFLPILLADTQPCDSIVCASSAAKKAIQNLLDHVGARFEEQYGTSLHYRGRMDVIPFGVDTERFQPSNKLTARARLGLPRNGLVLLWVGCFSLAHKADLIPLLMIFRELLKKSPRRELYLVLAGTDEGGYLRCVREFITSLQLRDAVRVIVHPLETATLYAAADVFVSPVDNLQESFGLAVIEAMAAGVPQIVSDWDGYKDLVVHGVTGFRVPTYWVKCDNEVCEISPLCDESFGLTHAYLSQSVVLDQRIYCEYLNTLIDNDDLRAEMGRRSRERAEHYYSWKAVVKQHEGLWKELLPIAQKQPWNPRQGRPFNQLAYFDSFHHYATRCFEDCDIVLSEAGRLALGCERVLPQHHPSADLGLLDEAILKRILVVFAGGKLDGRAMNQPLRLQQTAYNLAICHDENSIDSVRRHILWLAKYGFLILNAVHEGCMNS